MEQITYKSYKIQAAPYKSEEGDWLVSFYLHVETDEGLESTTYEVEDRFETRDAAVEHCFDYGKELIDAEEQGHYVIE